MVCRRRLHRLRTPKTLALLVIALLFLGIFMTYSTLNGHDSGSSSSPPGSSSLPNMDKRKPRYRAAHPKNALLGQELRSHLDRQFNAGLKVPEVREVISLLYPASWRSAREPDEAAILLKDKMLSLRLLSNMSCRDINEHQILGTLGQSSRKFVERLEEADDNSFDSYGGGGGGGGGGGMRDRRRQRKLMAVKSQASDVQTKVACMKQVYNADFCGPMGNYLLMREIFLLRFLQHPSLIGVLGYCLRGDRISMDLKKKGLVMVMEAGTPLVYSALVSMSWAKRLQLAMEAASLMEYLQSSPLGSVGLPGVQLKDFVLVNRRWLKLTDMDEALLGERQCSQAADCRLQGMDVGVPCASGFCEGLNHRINLRVVGSYVLDPLLRQMPAQEKPGVEEMLGRIRGLEVRPSQLVNFLNALVTKYPMAEDMPDNSKSYQHLKVKHFNARAQGGKWPEEEDEDEDEDREEDNGNGETGHGGERRTGDKKSLSPGKTKYTNEENPQPLNYMRMDSSNFPGQYDYPCPDSRVLWGCVMTFDRLQLAMDRCSSDTSCKSFVVFSPQPEEESKMTVVFKSSNTGPPRVNLGTTIFIRRLGKKSPRDPDPDPDPDQPILNKGVRDNQLPGHGLGKEDKGAGAGEGEEGWVQETERKECVKRSQGNQEDALRSREKRLMAHMGLKGKLEKDWKRAVRAQAVSGFTHLRPLSGQGSRGGSMMVVYNTSSAGHTVTRAKFMVEESAKQNHVAFALVYEIDRLLGLYHTPPMVAGFLPPSLVEKFSDNQTWYSTFGSLKHPDGTLRGLYVAPTPKVMKRAELGLKPLKQMVSEVVTFDRTQKMQLEYVLLWWLGHIAKPSNLHRGFKGHLIHVDADLGFQEPAVNYEGYFNHCQFPNVAYKMLSCFRCHQTTPSSRVCHLGQEVVQHLEETGFRLSSLHLQNVAEDDYPALINGAATRTLEIVEKCIEEFGREYVLY